MQTYLIHLIWLQKHLSLINAYRALPNPAMNEAQLRDLANARIALTAHLQGLFHLPQVADGHSAPQVGHYDAGES